MTAARLARHGSGIWTTDDVGRGVTGSETGVPHVGRNGGEIVRPHGEYCRPRILRKSLFALKQTSRRKSSSAAILSLSSYFLSATSIEFFFLRSVSSIRFLSSFALITTYYVEYYVVHIDGCSRRISRQSGDFIARAVDALFKIKAPHKFFQHCTRENRSINNVLTDVSMAKDTSAAQDKTSDENEDLRNQITDVAQQHIPVLVSLTVSDIFILPCFGSSTLRPQAMVRTILSHQRGVYRTEYRYELSDVNHLSETSSEERETDTKKTDVAYVVSTRYEDTIRYEKLYERFTIFTRAHYDLSNSIPWRARPSWESILASRKSNPDHSDRRGALQGSADGTLNSDILSTSATLSADYRWC
ncbi:hypothetical protein ALC56_05670 [Trachymyrmex septentrionalis]|uniref:Uncharacterized protein n=1 Tax=Trachymyrmex septentrionalis TaxID=34720 RepID=A0A195FI08_9HYME|nr:hypothetical protein ALC56_05670 [Trachymyrmex septentrionalis]